MGVLRDTEYWKSIVQQMVPFRPGPGKLPSPDDVQRLLRISCSAFTRLVKDPELQNDLDALVQAARQASTNLPDGTEAIKGYLDAFQQVETEILRRANVPEDAFFELDRAITAMKQSGLDLKDYQEVETRLKFIQEKVCGLASSQNLESDKAPLLGDLLVGAAAGTLVGAVDLTVVIGSAAAAVVVVPAAAATAAGVAAGLGALVGFSLNVPVRSWGNLWKHLRAS
jgi:hypothetical protein